MAKRIYCKACNKYIPVEEQKKIEQQTNLYNLCPLCKAKGFLVYRNIEQNSNNNQPKKNVDPNTPSSHLEGKTNFSSANQKDIVSPNKQQPSEQVNADDVESFFKSPAKTKEQPNIPKTDFPHSSLYDFEKLNRDELRSIAKKLGIRTLKSDTPASLAQKICDYEDDEVVEVLTELGYLKPKKEMPVPATNTIKDIIRDNLLSMQRSQVKAIAKILGENIYKADTVETLTKRVCSYPVDDIKAAINQALSVQDIYVPQPESASIPKTITGQQDSISTSEKIMNDNDGSSKETNNKEDDPDYLISGSDPSTYDPNADGYYDDTEPEQPAESFGNHRKTLFKVFFSILAIIAVIIYLVFTAGV